MRVAVRRIRCRDCGASNREPITFCPNPYVRYSLERCSRDSPLELCAVLKPLVRLSLKVCRKMLPHVRDLDSGTVLYIGKGKGGDALRKFRKRIKRKAKQIKAVAIDMANSYSAWVSEVLPDADIVYDHFHVIKCMNDNLNTLRQNTMNQLEDDRKKDLKGKRFLLLRNEESLSEESKKELGELRERFEDLGLASAMKEYLRNIYRIAPGASLAKRAFEKWCAMADESGIACLKTMAKTNPPGRISKRIQDAVLPGEGLLVKMRAGGRSGKVTEYKPGRSIDESSILN